MNEWEILNRIREEYQRILADKLTGIYVHGSIAFGCFRWQSSDIDFLVVTAEPLEQKEKEALIEVLLQLDPYAPAKGFEMSVMLASACSPFEDPVPYELHYSNAFRQEYKRDLAGTCRRMNGFDPDLAAHLTVVRAAGIVLCGAGIDEVFAPVPLESYIRSIWYDICDAEKEIERDPVYFTLNLCRVLACVEKGLVLSKAQGGEWGMQHIPEYCPLIAGALDAYRNGTPLMQEMPYGRFAGRILERIRRHAAFCASGVKND